MYLNFEEIKNQAAKEIREELFREAVEKYKLELKNKKSMWDVLFPWKIVIIRKGEKQNGC